MRAGEGAVRGENFCQPPSLRLGSGTVSEVELCPWLWGGSAPGDVRGWKVLPPPCGVPRVVDAGAGEVRGVNGRQLVLGDAARGAVVGGLLTPPVAGLPLANRCQPEAAGTPRSVPCPVRGFSGLVCPASVKPRPGFPAVTGLCGLAARPAGMGRSVFWVRIICWTSPARAVNDTGRSGAACVEKKRVWPAPRGMAPRLTVLPVGERLARVGTTGSRPLTTCPPSKADTLIGR